MTSDREVAVNNVAQRNKKADQEKSDDEEGRVITIGEKLKEDAKLNLEYLKSLPNPVKRRLRALANLQLKATNIEAEFFNEVHALECKYHKRYSELYEKRSTIVQGSYEPTDDEAVWSTKHENVDISEVLQTEEAAAAANNENNVKGIPGFWLHVLEHYPDTEEMIQKSDKPILKHLIDIKVVCPEDEMKFILEFHFSPNDYFEDEVIKKEYFLKCVPDEESPFQFEGPEIYKSTGHAIKWKPNKNVTKRTIIKHQKHKGTGTVRKITKEVNTDSFFMFFEPPNIPEGVNYIDLDEEISNMVTTDFTIGHAIRDTIVPKAALLYTGIWTSLDEDDFAEEETDEDEEDEDEEDEDEDEEDEDESGASRTRKAEDCKQQ